MKAGVAIVLLCLLVVVGGCHAPQQMQFGLYAVPQKDLPRAQEIGVDFVVGSKSKNYLQAAKQANLKVIGSGNEFPNDSTLMGNYLTDEPDLQEIHPDRIAQEFRTAKRRSDKPVFLNLSSGFSVASYVDYCDVVMFDWYPVGWQPLATFYSNLTAARLAAGKKPFYSIVQAFDWSKYPKLVPPSSNYRVPTPLELKAMTAWSAMSGVAGVVFYPYDDGHTKVQSTPELVTAIRESMEFIKANANYFYPPRIWGPYPFKFRELSDRYNEISEPSIVIKYTQAPAQQGGQLLVAANTTYREIVVTASKGVLLDSDEETIVFAPLEIKLFNAIIK